MEGKYAYITLTYLITVTPEDLGLSEDVTYSDFDEEATRYAQDLVDAIKEDQKVAVNDIEIEIF